MRFLEELDTLDLVTDLVTELAPSAGAAGAERGRGWRRAARPAGDSSTTEQRARSVVERPDHAATREA